MEPTQESIRVPEIYSMILRTIQAIEPSALIAGGCLRDLILGKEVKDIDIFIPSSDLGAIKRELDKISYVRGLLMEDQEEYKGSSFILASIDYTGKGPPLNLILVNDITTIPNNFDFGLNQISYRGDTIISTEAFNEDLQQQTFTLKWCENQERFDRCVRRFRRLWQKYPGYKLVIPPEFSHYQIVSEVF